MSDASDTGFSRGFPHQEAAKGMSLSDTASDTLRHWRTTQNGFQGPLILALCQTSTDASGVPLPCRPPAPDRQATTTHRRRENCFWAILALNVSRWLSCLALKTALFVPWQPPLFSTRLGQRFWRQHPTMKARENEIDVIRRDADSIHKFPRRPRVLRDAYKKRLHRRRFTSSQ